MDDELFYYLNRKHWIVVDKKIEESLVQLLSALRVVLGHTQSYSSSSFFIKIYPNEDTHIFICDDYKGIAKAYQWFDCDTLNVPSISLSNVPGVSE